MAARTRMFARAASVSGAQYRAPVAVMSDGGRGTYRKWKEVRGMDELARDRARELDWLGNERSIGKLYGFCRYADRPRRASGSEAVAAMVRLLA